MPDPISLSSPAAELSALIKAWRTAQSALSKAKAKELDLRNAICRLVGSEEEGTLTRTVGDFTVKVTTPYNRTFDTAVLSSVLTRHPEWVDTVVKFKPALSLSEYRNIDPKERRALDAAIICKAGQQQLEIKKDK